MGVYTGRFAREIEKTLMENHRSIVSVLEPVSVYCHEDSEDYIPAVSKIGVGTAMIGYAIVYTVLQGAMMLLKAPHTIRNVMEEQTHHNSI